MSDEELLLWQAVQEGEGVAFGQVYDLHRNRVYRHAVRLVDTYVDAEDVTAVAFLELWRNRGRVRLVNGSVLPWLLVTTTNASRNLHRSVRRHRALLDRLPRGRDGADPAQIYIDHSIADGLEPDLVAQLRQLSGIDQQIVVLVALEGYSQAEAAAALDLSLSALKARLHRVRAKLRPHRPTLYPSEATS